MHTCSNLFILCRCSGELPLTPPFLHAAPSRHTRGECDPANYDRVHRKPRCPAPGCREKLVSTNSYTCRECGVTVRALLPLAKSLLQPAPVVHSGSVQRRVTAQSRMHARGWAVD